MCQLCEATTDAVLSELERAVMLAEAEAGLGDPSARRPLSEAEQRAQVRFGEIAALEDEYLGRVEPVLVTLRGVVDAEILAALAGAATAAGLVAALEALVAVQPGPVVEAAREAAHAVQEALQAVYAGSSAVVVGEAARQGVVALPEPLEARAGVYQAAAARITAEPWQKALTVARQEVTNPRVLVGEVLDADLVPAALADYSNAGVIDLARQFAHGALNTARFDTAEQLPFESAYSSEILDSNTCDACAREDGAEYESLAELRAAYPNGGGFRACSGAARCRGTGVLVFRT